MDDRYLIERFNGAISFLPEQIKETLLSLPNDLKTNANEIRLRVGKEISLSIKDREYRLSDLKLRTVIINKYIIENSFNRLCEFSVYSHQTEINNGFITLYGGHRVGICGTFIYENGKIKNIRDISSLNIRISKEFIGISENIIKYAKVGLLIAGPPSAGKTTYLRDAVYEVSKTLSVAVIDSRGEICAVKNGVAENRTGSFCDILNLAKKADGIEFAIRTLNPKIIAFDEITDINEAELIERSANSGVNFILTLHIGNSDDLYFNKLSRKLFLCGAVKFAAVLDRNRNVSVYRVDLKSDSEFQLQAVDYND